MTRAMLLCSGIVILAMAWLGPLPTLARQSFGAHMLMHVGVIAVAAPFIALAIAGSRHDPVRYLATVFSPIAASLVELVVVWAWHAPLLHHAARTLPALLVLEQASFLLAGVLVWLAAFGGSARQRRQRAIASVSGLLFTSMHMTLLGVLLALADRVLYAHATETVSGLSALQDQQLGGVIMLFAGGAAYLAGALLRVAGLMQEKRNVVSAA